ncbi:MAG TPA: hypothetical protein VGF39_09555 [Stellaceae bacterium]|jgi:Holliday junction resolvasome RuvABC endonuclease subunit
MRILGVDPGVSGGYAMLDSGAVVEIDDLPVVNKQINAAHWRHVVERLEPEVAVVEDVHSMPKQGVASTFKFGMAVGLIRGVLIGAGVPIISVAPTVWKKFHHLIGDDGEKARALAISRFPRLEGLARKRDHNRSEALLIALWHWHADDPV